MVLHVVSVDVVLNPEWGDVSREATQRFWFRGVTEKWVVGYLAGPPCQTWSCAREVQLDPQPEGASRSGPRVVRTLDELFGLSALSVREIRQVLVGNILLLFSLTILALLSGTGGCGILEHPGEPANPRSASIWRTEIVGLLLRLPGFNLIRFSQGLLGAKSAKPTAVLVLNVPSMATCIHASRICANLPVAASIGKDIDGHWKTMSLKEYPPALCFALARGMASAVSELEACAGMKSVPILITGSAQVGPEPTYVNGQSRRLLSQGLSFSGSASVDPVNKSFPFTVDIPCCIDGDIDVEVVIFDFMGAGIDPQLRLFLETATGSLPIPVVERNNMDPPILIYRGHLDDDNLVGFSLEDQSFSLIIETRITAFLLSGAQMLRVLVKDCTSTSQTLTTSVAGPPSTTVSTTVSTIGCPSSELVELSGPIELEVGPREIRELASVEDKDKVGPESIALASLTNSRKDDNKEVTFTHIPFDIDIPCCANGTVIVKVTIDGPLDEMLELWVENDEVFVDLPLPNPPIAKPGGLEYIAITDDSIDVRQRLFSKKSSSEVRDRTRQDEGLAGYSLASKTFELIIRTSQRGTFLRGSVEFGAEECRPFDCNTGFIDGVLQDPFQVDPGVPDIIRLPINIDCCWSGFFTVELIFADPDKIVSESDIQLFVRSDDGPVPLEIDFAGGATFTEPGVFGAWFELFAVLFKEEFPIKSSSP
eukprot:s676_g22.t1